MERLRMAARISRKQLAQTSGVAERTIRELESGRVATPRDVTLFPIADALGVDPTELKQDFANQHEEAAA